MGYDVTMDRGSAGVEQAGNIYEARAAGINLLDESTGIDSSAIPGLLKEAIAKSGESVEEIAKKPRIFQKRFRILFPAEIMYFLCGELLLFPIICISPYLI